MGVEEDAIYQHVERSARGGAPRRAVIGAAAIETRQDDTRGTELTREAHGDILAESAIHQLSAINSHRLEDERDGDTRADGLRQIAMIERHPHSGVKIRGHGAERNRK